MENLVKKFAPVLYYHEDEPYFPITIEKYLSVCELRKNNTSFMDPDLKNSTIIEEKVTPDILGNYIDEKDANTFLNFSDPNYSTKIAGDVSDTTCYVKILPLSDDKYAFIYFYIYQQVLPYKLCNCCCNLNSYMHLGDIKAIVVYVEKDNITGIYYCAHGHYQGEYVDAKNINFKGTHPIAYPCYGDHSNYYNIGCHPRICGFVCDKTEDGFESTPKVIIVDDNTSWCKFIGNMNNEGIRSPGFHDWWTADVPIEESNNWLKRFCCYKYW